MMKKIIFCLSIAMLLASLALAGCASQAAKTPGIFTILSREPGSTSYATYLPIAATASKYSGMKVNLEPAGGLVDVWPVLKRGEAQMATDAAGFAYSLYNGVLYWDKEAQPWLRMVYNSYATGIIWGTKPASKIYSWKDMEGKKLMVASSTSPRIKVFTDAMLGKYGVKNATVLPYSNFNDAVQQLIQGKVDVIADSAGSSAWMDADRSPDGLRFLPMTQEEIDFINNKIGIKLYDLTTNPPGYLSMKAYEKETNAFGDRHIAITSKDASEDQIYRFVKAIYQHTDEYKTVYPPCADFTLNNALTAHVIPVHPGAIKFYKEAGIWTANDDALEKKLAKG